MKRWLLIGVAALCSNGCVYSRPPYGYSHHPMVTTPIYPQYDYHYSQPPSPRFRYEYEERRPHFNQYHRHYW